MARAGPSIVAASAVHELAPAGSLLPLAAGLRRRFGSFWLDSALAGGRLGRFSYAGAGPYAVVRAFGDVLDVECLRAARPDLAPGRTRSRGDVLGLLAPLLAPRPSAGVAELPPFAGGAVGFVGYELAAQLEPALALRARDDLGLPDLALLLVDRVVALEHASGRRFACALGYGEGEAQACARAREALDDWLAELAALGGSPDPAPLPPRPAGASAHPCPAAAAAGADTAGGAARAASSLDAGAYRAAVVRLLGHIGRGDVYQACLTRRVELPFAGDPWRLYLAVREASPAPFGAWLALPEALLLSASPERFLAVDPGGRVESRPIKGTRPRGAGPEADRALARELAASAKDRAENLMIADLVRNDLGRVCRTGSVEVAELAALESYANVHHLVSTVRGRLRPDAGVLELLRAAFPPGSMTGAPKLAAMQLLDALEPVRRGPYAGALGYLDARGGASLAVVIRTAIVREGRAYVHTGAGIVADSDPDAEWRESEDKARTLLRAVAEHGAGAPGSAGARQRPAR